MTDRLPKLVTARVGPALLRAAVALAVALVVVSALAMAARVSPAEAISALGRGGFGGTREWIKTALHATPVLLTGLAVAWAFRAGLFNIGAEGQLLWGALAAAWAGTWPLPAFLHLPVALVVGALAGALWAWPAVALKIRRGTPEVVTTLLLNWVALHLTTYCAAHPLHDPAQQGARTHAVLPSAFLPVLALERSRLHAGILIGVVAAVALGVALAYSRFGFQLRVVGHNPEAARASDIPVRRIWTLALLQSGAMAGLAGAVEILGRHHYFDPGFTPGYGYDGIAVAILGGSTPAGIAAAAILWGGLANGAVELEISTGVSRHLVTVIQALVVLVAAVRRWPRLRRAPAVSGGAASGR